MVKVSVPAIADVIIDPSPGLGLLEIEVCGLVERIIEGKTTYFAGVVVDPVLKLGFGGFLTELDAVPAEQAGGRMTTTNLHNIAVAG